jgi:hypothetical protein
MFRSGAQLAGDRFGEVGEPGGVDGVSPHQSAGFGPRRVDSDEPVLFEQVEVDQQAGRSELQAPAEFGSGGWPLGYK